MVQVTHATAEAFLLSGSLEARMAESAVSSPNRRAFEAIMNCSAQLYSTRSTVKGCVIGDICVFKWDERGPEVLRERNGGGCDRPRPFRIIAIWASIMLSQCRGITVRSAQVSCGLGIMSWCWGL